MATSVRFLHTADTQFGTGFGSLPPQIADLKRTSQREGFSSLVQHAIKQKLDLFLLSGDVFDTAHPAIADISFVKKELQRLEQAGIRAFVIPGNHDSSGPGSLWEQYGPWPGHVFLTPGFSSVLVAELDVEVFGMGFDRSHSSDDPLAADRVHPQTSRSIMLFHGAWQNFGRELDRDYPFSTEDMMKVPCNYIALGHYHAFSMVLDQPQKKAVYSGDTEGLDFSANECGPRCAVQGEISADGMVTLEQIPLSSLVMARLDLDVSTYTLAGLDHAIQDQADARTLLEVHLTGIPSIDLFREIPVIEQACKHLFLHFLIEDRTIDVQTNDLEKSQTYQGIFYRALKDKLAKAATEDEKAAIRQALQIGLAAFQ